MVCKKLDNDVLFQIHPSLTSFSLKTPAFFLCFQLSLQRSSSFKDFMKNKPASPVSEKEITPEENVGGSQTRTLKHTNTPLKQKSGSRTVIIGQEVPKYEFLLVFSIVPYSSCCGPQRSSREQTWYWYKCSTPRRLSNTVKYRLSCFLQLRDK